MASMLLGRICRTCLEKSDEMHKLRKYVEDNVQIEEMLTQAVPDFDLEIDDTPLPVEICTDCLEKLRVTYNFHKKCMETNTKLREMLDQQYNEEEDEMAAELQDMLKEDVLVDNLKKEPMDEASNGSNNFAQAAPIEELPDVLSPSFQIDPVKLEIGMDDDKMGADSDFANSSDDYWPNDDKEDSESNLNVTADIKPKRKYQKKAIVKVCSQCNKSYTNERHFTRHMTVHSMENKSVCDICQYRYSNDKELKRHIRSKHTDSKPKKINILDGPYPCPDCPKVFEQKRSLAKHSVLHTTERDLKCEVCGANCKVMAALSRHMRSKHPDFKPYKCKLCEKAFAIEIHLTDHIKEHLGEKKYKCEMCEKSFVSPGALEDHIRMHTGETPYLCFQCGAAFKSWNVLRQHLQIHGEKKFQCPECPKKCYSQGVLTKHMRSHAPVKRHVCDICGTGFTRKSTLNDHKFKHTGLRPFKCEECNLRHLFETSDIKPKKTCENSADTVKKHVCTQCTNSYAIKRLLNRHISSVHSMENKSVCDICQYRYSSDKELKKHITRKHSEIKPLKVTYADGPYPCPDCPKIFEKKRSLLKHKVMHMERDFKCEVCGEICKIMSSLTRHMKVKHPDILPYKCQTCEKAFPVETHLNDHIREEHLGQKKYKCDMCEKSFPCTNSLQNHIRTHTGETPFLCSQCGASFKAANVLQQHLLTHGEEKFQCPDCPKKFRAKTYLVKHINSHASVKRHICDICGTGFTRKDTLTAHKFKHTGLRPFKCEECNLSFVFKSHWRKHKIVHTGEKPHQCTYCDRAYAASGDLVKHLRTHVGEKTYFCNECPEAFKYLNDLKDHKNQHYKDKLALQTKNEEAQEGDKEGKKEV